MKIFEIVRTRDLRSFYVVAKDAVAAMGKHQKRLDRRNEDKYALLFEISNSLVLRHRGDVYCVVKDKRKAREAAKKRKQMERLYKNYKDDGQPKKCFNCHKKNEKPLALYDELGRYFICEYCGSENADDNLEVILANTDDEILKKLFEEDEEWIEKLELELEESNNKMSTPRPKTNHKE